MEEYRYFADVKRDPPDASPDTISYVSILSYCKPCRKLYDMFADIYINNGNKVNRSTAVTGLLDNFMTLPGHEKAQGCQKTLVVDGL